jgi:hypothetical protein
VFPLEHFTVGDRIDALDSDGRWFESRVLEVAPDEVYVHFRGWGSRWDEYLEIGSRRLAPLHTFTGSNPAPWPDASSDDEAQPEESSAVYAARAAGIAAGGGPKEPSHVARAVRELLLARGMSQEAVVRDTGISAATLSLLLNLHHAHSTSAGLYSRLWAWCHRQPPQQHSQRVEQAVRRMAIWGVELVGEESGTGSETDEDDSSDSGERAAPRRATGGKRGPKGQRRAPKQGISRGKRDEELKRAKGAVSKNAPQPLASSKRKPSNRRELTGLPGSSRKRKKPPQTSPPRKQTSRSPRLAPPGKKQRKTGALPRSSRILRIIDIERPTRSPEGRRRAAAR